MLTVGGVFHIELKDGRRFYCRLLKKSRGPGAAWFGGTGFAEGGTEYQAITRNLPWERTPDHDIPAAFRVAGPDGLFVADRT